jgi:uncharacterized protein YqhQ
MSAREHDAPPRLYYGGQAVVEGVMMRGPRNMAVAVRAPDGSIVSRAEPLPGRYRGVVRRIPFVRGLFVLFETLSLGIRSLTWSSQVSEGKDAIEPSPGQLRTTLVFAVTFITAFFFLLPVALTGWLTLLGVSARIELLLEGLVRIGMFVAYVALIGRVPDVQRLFGYHGAEHRAIQAHEKGRPLTPESVREYPNAHVRCGTAFLLTIMVISLVLFAALGTESLWVRAVERVVLLPLIAALAYEILRLAQMFGDNPVFGLVYRPNLWLQRLTTRDPDDGMVEVALAALERVVAMEEASAAAEAGRQFAAEEPLA